MKTSQFPSSWIFATIYGAVRPLVQRHQNEAFSLRYMGRRSNICERCVLSARQTRAHSILLSDIETVAKSLIA